MLLSWLGIPRHSSTVQKAQQKHGISKHLLSQLLASRLDSHQYDQVSKIMTKTLEKQPPSLSPKCHLQMSTKYQENILIVFKFIKYVHVYGFFARQSTSLYQSLFDGSETENFNSIFFLFSPHPLFNYVHILPFLF